MPDETVLRAKAREVIRTGKLPSRRPDRTWGGPGVGAPCTVCGEAVTKDQMEFEASSPAMATTPDWTSSTFTSAASQHGSSSANGMAAHTASSMDQESLRLIIRRKLQNGRLPHNGIRRVASSPNARETCDACDAIVAMDQLLMEGITLDLGRKPLQLHVRCFQMWDHERRVT